MKLNPFYLKANKDNILGAFGSLHVEDISLPSFTINGERTAFVNRPTKGKTSRKKLFPPHGVKTNIGDPCKSWNQKKKKS